MQCKVCGAEMTQNDKDYNFKGNYDNYWVCNNCKTSCIEEVRYGKTYKELWHSERNGVKDFEIKHRIDRRRI